LSGLFRWLKADVYIIQLSASVSRSPYKVQTHLKVEISLASQRPYKLFKYTKYQTMLCVPIPSLFRFYLSISFGAILNYARVYINNCGQNNRVTETQN